MAVRICAACKAENDEKNRFCHACGTALVQAAPGAAAAPPAAAPQPSADMMEITITERVTERLIKWARLSFTLFVVPVVAVIVFLGFRTFTDFTNLRGSVQKVSSDIETASAKLSGRFEEISGKLAAIQGSIDKFNVSDERIIGMMDALAHVEAKVKEYYLNTIAPEQVKFIDGYFRTYMGFFRAAGFRSSLSDPAVVVTEEPTVGPPGAADLIVFFNPAARRIEIGRLAIQSRDRALFDFARTILQIGLMERQADAPPPVNVALAENGPQHIIHIGDGLARYFAAAFKDDPTLALDGGNAVDLSVAVVPGDRPGGQGFAAIWAHRFWQLHGAVPDQDAFNAALLGAWRAAAGKPVPEAGGAFIKAVEDAGAQIPALKDAAKAWRG